MKKLILKLIGISFAFVFTVTAAQSAVFDDVTESDWFYDYVQGAYNFGFINGRTATSFAPTKISPLPKR